MAAAKRVQRAEREEDGGAGKIVGSTTGATPNATDTMANPIKTIEAHTPKPISDEFWRSCIGTRRYRIVGENKVMSISNQFLRTMTRSLKSASRFEPMHSGNQ